MYTRCKSVADRSEVVAELNFVTLFAVSMFFVTKVRYLIVSHKRAVFLLENPFLEKDELMMLSARCINLTVKCYRKNVFFLQMEQLFVNVCQYFLIDSNANTEISECMNK